METFNIFKPDMASDESFIRMYLAEVQRQIGISPRIAYLLSDYSYVCKLLYELDTQSEHMDLEAIRAKRKQILTTIKAYEMLYPSMPAIAVTYVLDHPEQLNQFYRLKKEMRRLYVYDSKKVFVKFLDDIDYSLPLTSIDTASIRALYRVTSPAVEELSDDFNLAFFNKIHCPDPEPELVDKEIMILKKGNLFHQKRRVYPEWIK